MNCKGRKECPETLGFPSVLIITKFDMGKYIIKFFGLFLITSILFSCEEKPESVGSQPEPEEELKITEFVVKAPSGGISGDIDQSNKTISVSVPSDLNIKKVLIDVSYTEGAVLKPESGYEYNFSSPVTFKLTKGAKTVSYVVTLGVKPEILAFDLSEYHIKGKVGKDDVTLSLPYGADITAVAPSVIVPSGCIVSPASGEIVNLEQVKSYKVTNLAGVVKEYKIEINYLPQEKQIRGVWVPDPTHTDVLRSYDKLKNFVSLLDELNMNAIYLATWVREQTLFKSNVLLENTNYKTLEDGWLLKGSTYKGLTDDPISDLIALAHEKGIKVFFWFEYGFMRSGNASTQTSSHPILSVHPEWDGVNSYGTPANYNNTDFYMNSYDPEVQNFIIGLIKESISLYPEVDGVQGDDRLPAAPRNSGYNASTKALYMAETGKDVPDNYQDKEWVSWRLSKLNDFGKRLYSEVKALDNSLLVSFSPNPYPWCEQNLMQDWPSWIKGGYVDFLSVQCYRDTEAAYRATLNEVMGYVKANTDKNICNPGIYLRSGSDWANIFTAQMLYNREKGTNGEAFFFNNGLTLDVNKKVIKSFYTGKAVFPF